jgi:glycosyltransferase involved in cell wall biosynthesis
MSLIEKYGIGDKITIIGRVPHDELMSYYKKGMIDCAVLTSLYEGIPVSLMEAMSYGVPAISTNVGGTKELLGDGAGILVEVGNCDEIATAMERVMTDGIIRETLSKTGRQRIKEQFDARITTAGLLEKMKEYV